ncbi:WD-40 repeat-containing protein, partial [Reticulomyxa filosa]
FWNTYSFIEQRYLFVMITNLRKRKVKKIGYIEKKLIMPTKLELALCISKGNLIDIFDIHSGVLVRSLQLPVNQVSLLHDSFLVYNEVNKPILSVINYRLNRVKWKCVIPKEVALGPMAVHFSQCSNDNNNYKAIGSDPRFLCVGTNSGHIYTWCLLTGQLLKIFKAHLQKINCLVFTPDGNCLISASDDCLIKQYAYYAYINIYICMYMYVYIYIYAYITIQTIKGVGSMEPYLTWKDHVMPVTDIICGTSGPSGCPRIFTCSLDCSVKIYSLLPLVKSKSTTSEKQSSSSSGNTFDLMSANSTHLLQSVQFPHPLTSLACDPAMNFLLVASRHGELFRINLIDFPSAAQSIQHIIDSDPKTLLADVTYRTIEHDNTDTKSNNKSDATNNDAASTLLKSNQSQQLVLINDISLSYDGRMAVTAHSDGTACVWDVLFGTKIRVLNKHRRKYDRVICICDRLGSYATHGIGNSSGTNLVDPNLAPDIKYEKFSLYVKNWPLAFKRHYSSDQFRDISHLTNKRQQASEKNKYPLILPPKEMSIYLPGAIVGAADLGVTWEQRRSDTVSGKYEGSRKNERYGENSWWSDEAFLERIENEFSILQTRNTSLQADTQEPKNAVDTGLCKELLDENLKLKSEIEKWKELHQSLYHYTCQKVLDLDQ